MKSFSKQQNSYDVIFLNYVAKTNDNMSRKQFVLAFLSSLILVNLSHNYNEMDDKYFNQTMLLFIEDTSLCKPEFDFLKEMLDIDCCDLNAYIDLYKQTKNLSKCQLGPLMFRMLEHAKLNIKLNG
jgi:hypothetical protein